MRGGGGGSGQGRNKGSASGPRRWGGRRGRVGGRGWLVWGGGWRMDLREGLGAPTLLLGVVVPSPHTPPEALHAVFQHMRVGALRR